jgi:hypothetical protein
VEAALGEGASAQVKTVHVKRRMELLKALNMRNFWMARKAADASVRWHDLKAGEHTVIALKHKQKMPWDKVNTPQMQASLVHWLLTLDLIIPSPSKKDAKQHQDHWPGERLVDEEGNYELQRNYYHKTPKDPLWGEAQKDPQQEGWLDLHTEDGKLRMKKTMFDSLTLDYFKQFTKSQMRMCACKDCENTKVFPQAKLGWNNSNVKEMGVQVKELEDWT